MFQIHFFLFLLKKRICSNKINVFIVNKHVYCQKRTESVMKRIFFRFLKVGFNTRIFRFEESLCKIYEKQTYNIIARWKNEFNSKCQKKFRYYNFSEWFLLEVIGCDSPCRSINFSFPFFRLFLNEKSIFSIKIIFQGCKMQKYFIKHLQIEKNSINLPDFLLQIEWIR